MTATRIHPTAQQIWKFPLPQVHSNEVAMPRGAEVISVAEQGGQLVLWAAVCPDNEFEIRTFVVAMTGIDLPEGRDRVHVGTVLLHDGRLVLHVLELSAEPPEPVARAEADSSDGELMRVSAGIHRK